MNRYRLIIRYVVTGTLFVVVPILILLILFGKALTILMPLAHALTHKFNLTTVLGPAAVLLVSSVLILLISFLSGYFIVNGFLKQWNNKFEATLFYHFPSFQMMKYRFISEADYKKQNFWQPILLKDDKLYNIAFITDKSQPKFISIYIPDAPKMDAGEVRYMLTKDCEYIPITMKEAMNGIRDFGKGLDPKVFSKTA
ncbi:hypothetical protein [Formosa algae]|uniref:Membrane protein n=1 Tax=Formosa algae TaxID=225843 RepID=A0A9X0YIN5_9FLAO|nr:hypothetical protein [Formosa algae]MBP1839452.1 putative membrane protein [Formosa algae]MDQ0334756.1 putative membrane protein [Formosa algae]